VSELKLPVHDADPQRVERIRARCVAALAAQHGREQVRRGRDEARQARCEALRAWLETVAAAGLGALFLADAVARSLALLR
jgi:hypothetical protein